MLGFYWIVFLKKMRAFKNSKIDSAVGVFADSAVSMTPLSFDSAVSVTPLSFDSRGVSYTSEF